MTVAAEAPLEPHRPGDGEPRLDPVSVFGLTGDPGLTIEQARACMAPNIRRGARCPCCGQLARIYKRRLHATMAAALVFCVRRHDAGDEWVHMGKVAPRAVLRGKDFGLLRLWGLMEERPIDDVGPASGFWRATRAGLAFAKNQSDAPLHVYEGLGGRVFGFSDRRVTVIQALGNRFDYWELVRT